MRIIHTSDWHLGKFLEGHSRLDEQMLFIDELCDIAQAKNVDLILLSGDVYDTVNPPAQAETLFYSALSRLSNKRRRPVVVIAGNHDNAERLAACGPIAWDQGIFIFGTSKSIAPIKEFENFSIVDAGEGYFELHLRGEKTVILTMPYPSEKRLNELTEGFSEEEEFQKSYSQKIGEIFSKNECKFREDTINLAMAHLFVTGGSESSSERPIQLGGSFAVNAGDLPKKAQYIALGHLHRPQKVGGTEGRGFYSGSPLQYSKDEIIYAKGIQLIDVKPAQKPIIEKMLLKNYKPVECWRAKSIEESIALCEEKKEENCWVYLQIETDRVLEQWEIKKIRTTKADIVEIEPVFGLLEKNIEEKYFEEISPKDQFYSYYMKKRNVAPTEELMDIFLKILNDEEENNEASALKVEGTE